MKQVWSPGARLLYDPVGVTSQAACKLLKQNNSIILSLLNKYPHLSIKLYNLFIMRYSYKHIVIDLKAFLCFCYWAQKGQVELKKLWPL